VRAQNTQLAAGELGQLPAADGQQINAVIVTRSRLATPEEFGEIIVKANAAGATVRVKDIARVELGAQDYSIAARTDQQASAAIAVRMAPGANALDTAKAVEAHGGAGEILSQGISWVIPYDTSRFVDISIREVLKTLAEAMALVFLVMYVFLGNLRATFIPPSSCRWFWSAAWSGSTSSATRSMC
jgi:multidrug efflux pump